ncbi:MAG: hypothetical protein C5B50_17190, partial [Verrucomicrobia bacterium]
SSGYDVTNQTTQHLEIRHGIRSRTFVKEQPNGRKAVTVQTPNRCLYVRPRRTWRAFFTPRADLWIFNGLEHADCHTLNAPNDLSSATRRTGRNDYNRDSPAKFAAAQ